MSDSNASTPAEKTNPWSTPVFIMSAAFVGILVVALIGVLMLSSIEEKPAAEGSSPSSTKPSSSDSVCGLPSGDQSIPKEAPASTWELVGTMAAPVAKKTLGPGAMQDGVRACFAQSPSGALYFVVNFLAQTSGDKAIKLAATEALVLDSPGRDAALSRMEGEVALASTPTVQVAGFRFIEYGPSVVVIDLAIRGSNGAYISVPTEVAWAEGDWKIVLNDDGESAATIRQIPSTSGYIEWGGA